MIEKLYIWIAWQLPKELVCHIYARVVANYTQGHPDKSLPSVSAMDALSYWIYGKDRVWAENLKSEKNN